METKEIQINESAKQLFITADEIKAIKSELPKGAYRLIARETGFSLGLVSYVMNGERPINIKTIAIIECARRIIDDFAARCEAAKQSNSNQIIIK